MTDASLRLFLCALALPAIVGCLTPARPPAKAQAPQGPAAREPISIQAFSRNPFLAVTLPASPMHRHEEAVKALGSPIETTARDAPSQHDPSIINSLITLRYAFGDLVYLHVAGKDVENLILVRLHGNQVPLKYGIRFGTTTRAQILKLFGTPQEKEENSFSYNVPYTQEITSSTTFYFRDDTLLEVEISSLMMD